MRLHIAVVATLVVASTARAQLPHYWAQPGLGFGIAGRRNEYNNVLDIVAHARLGVRLSSTFGIEASGLITGPIATADRITNTILCRTPSGQPTGCPDPTSFMISGADASLVRSRKTDSRLSIGVGNYVLSRYRTDRSSTRAFGAVAGADFDITRIHPSLTLGVHLIYMPNVRGSNEWFLPIEAGIRF